MARRRHQDEGGSVGFGGLFGTSFGYVGTSIYFVLGALGLYALGVTPLLILVVGLVFVATAWSYAEGSAAMPASSGATSFARRAFNPLAGFVAAWALLLDSIVLVAIVSSCIPAYLSVFWPQLQDWPYDFLTSLAVLVIVVSLNVLGAHESMRLDSLMTFLGLVTLVLLVVVGFLMAVQPDLLWNQVDFGVAPAWGSLLYAVPLAAAAFLGIDAVSSRAGKALRPGRDVPRAINVVLPLIVALAVGLAAVALSSLPVSSNVVPVDAATGLTRPVPVVPGDEAGVFVLASDSSTVVVVPVQRSASGHVIPAQEPTDRVASSPDGPVTHLYGTLLGSAYLENPLVGLVAGLPDSLNGLKGVLRPWIAILVAASLLLAANAVLGGSARILYSLARHHQVPAALGRVHATRMTPYVGILLFGLVAAALLVPDDPVLLFGLFGFGAALAFTLANASVVALRYREPAISRPFVIPFNVRFRGIPLPVPAVAGTVTMAVIWVLMVTTHAEGAIVGFVWLAGGLALYTVYRRRAGYSLLTQPQEASLPAAALSDVDYDRILVPVQGSRLSDEMMVLACQLAAEKDAVIDVLYVLEVPMNLPLDASLPGGRARGKHVLDTAIAVAREFGVEAWPHLVSARAPGRAIVDTALEWGSDVIIMGAVRTHRADGRLVGGTVAHVMRKARAEVLLNLVAEDYPMLGSAAEYDAAQAAAKSQGSPETERG